MSEINEPKEVLSDDDRKQIAEELVEWYDFDGELDDEEINEFELDEANIVANYTNYIDMSQLNADVTALNMSTYAPAQVIRVLTKTTRTLSSGQVVIDYELEINGVQGAKSYELRVLAQ